MVLYMLIVVCLFFSDNPSHVSHVPVTIQVLDVNDNAPYIARDDEIIVCESSRAGQVSIFHFHLPPSFLLFSTLLPLSSTFSPMNSYSPLFNYVVF